jgi:hypothetical protein
VATYDDYKRNPFLAAPDIGRLVRNGCLNLFLGAGASAGFGLPEWPRLVSRIVDGRDDDALVEQMKKRSEDEQAKLVNAVDTEDEAYYGRVHHALYDGVADKLLEQLTRSPLLLAVTALLTGTCRGRIRQVFTYNYDDLLEQYLKILGHEVCTRVNPTDFSTWADVEINHVHGYIPQSWEVGQPTTKIILSSKSYRDKRISIGEEWSRIVEDSFYMRPALMVGLSGDDSSIVDVFALARKKIQRPEDYHGYWILTPEAYAKHMDTLTHDNVKHCPICLPKDKIPQFIFAVCQEAAK